MRLFLRIPALTTRRILIAYAAGAITDAVQIGLIPLGPVALPLDEGLDVLAMAVTTAALGFHPLLLPTFLLELVPVVGALPTWTGCITAVVLLRRQRRVDQPPIATTITASPPEPIPPPKQLPHHGSSSLSSP
jgi:hypothetical protein